MRSEAVRGKRRGMRPGSGKGGRKGAKVLRDLERVAVGLKLS